MPTFISDFKDNILSSGIKKSQAPHFEPLGGVGFSGLESWFSGG